jgi:hypothetical protein
MAKLIVYSKKKNPQCAILKDTLKEVGIPYHEIDIRKPEAMTELRNKGCFVFKPPILQVIQDRTFQWVFANDDLFRDGQLVQDTMLDVMRLSRPLTSWPY